MRINDRNYPILKYLNWRKPLMEHPYFLKHHDLDVFRPDRAEEKDRDAIGTALDIMRPMFLKWPEYAELFSKQVDMVSDPFFMAAMNNRDRIVNEQTLREILPPGEKVSGTLIWKKIVFCYCYEGYQNEACEHVTVIAHYEGRMFYACDDLKEFLSKENCVVEGISPLNDFMKIAPVIILLFKKYAEVETVEAQKDKKVRTPDGDKLLVETDVKVNYIDCSWFRTIVRNEGFMVSGHFRLQPCKKDGEWTRKLIYIEPYQKHGYTRKAKIERQ